MEDRCIRNHTSKRYAADSISFETAALFFFILKPIFIPSTSFSGLQSYASVSSAQESWAELESQNLRVDQPSDFSFYVLQQRIEINKIDLVQLYLVPADGSNATLLSSIKNSPVNWQYETVTLTPAMGTFSVSTKHI
jgi:hypothetical protein